MTPQPFTITKDLVDSIHKSLDFGLTKGLGKPIEGQMCVEALICAKLGLPHSDNPPCVGDEVRRAKILLNDCNWSSNKARAEGMRELAIAQLGSVELDQKTFSDKLKLASTKRILPYIIQKYFDETKDDKLLEYKTKFEQLEVLDDKLWREFYNNNYYYNNYNNNYNYNYYNYYYYNNNNNNNNYYYNNYNNNYYNYNYYYYYNNNNNYNFGDEFLLLIADTILSVLIDMKSPGCEWI